MSKRSNGEGSITKRPDGGWESDYKEKYRACKNRTGEGNKYTLLEQDTLKTKNSDRVIRGWGIKVCTPPGIPLQACCSSETLMSEL